MNTGAIVLGGHVQGYGVVKILGQAEIPSIVIDKTSINIARHSTSCKNFYRAEYNEVVDLLLKFARSKLYKNWMLIPTDDYFVRILSQNRNMLSEHFKVSVDEWEVVNLFFDKRNSYPLADSADVPVPKTSYPGNLDELMECSKDIEYPCIIKPAVMLDFYRQFKTKVFVCESPRDLSDKYHQAADKLGAQSVMVQEIIPGSTEAQYSVGMFFDRDQSYDYLVARRRHQHPLDFGNATTYAETAVVPELVEYSERILKKAGFWGLCEIEFKHDQRDGKFKFLEVNPRTWKWHAIANKAGIPFLLSMYNYLYKHQPLIKKDYKPAAWCDIVTDIPVRFEMKGRKMDTRIIKRDLEHAVLNLKDIKPFLYQLLYVPYFVHNR